jgi:excisionase family DNA binding protein
LPGAPLHVVHHWLSGPPVAFAERDATGSFVTTDADLGAMLMHKLLFTAEEAAEIIGVGRTKMYELLRIGAVRSVRIGRCRRIPRDALAAFVDDLREDASGYNVD